MILLYISKTSTRGLLWRSVGAAVLAAVLAGSCAGEARAGWEVPSGGSILAKFFGGEREARDGGAPRSGAAAASPVAETPLKAGVYSTNDAQAIKVVLDPGHGGMSEKASKAKGDHWDIKAGRFLTNYNFGANCPEDCEHKIVLEICKKAAGILARANTDAGWREFSKLLAEYGVMRPEEYRRVKFAVALTRDDSYEAEKYKGDDNVNRHFRLFDSPESFDKKGIPSKKLFPGRMSKINALEPDLVLCVHVNSSTNVSMRGSASVIIPSYHVFSFVKTMRDKLGMRGALTYFWVLSWMYPDNMILGKLSDLINDCETYFTGKRASTKGSIGKRWQMVQWRYHNDEEYNDLANYKNPDSYWKRERSREESFRRDGGAAGFGGDNFYASEEVLKFIRMGLWKDYLGGAARTAPDASKVKTPNEYLGNHGRPFISDWALPQMINAVTAYLELGYLENTYDRAILTTRKDVIAKAMAVAVYSLAAGMTPAKLPVTKEKAVAAMPGMKPAPVAGTTAGTSANDGTIAPAEAKPVEKPVSFIEKPKTARLLNKIRKNVGAKPIPVKTQSAALAMKALSAQEPAQAEETVYSRMPLELPLGQKIDLGKYGSYIREVLGADGEPAE